MADKKRVCVIGAGVSGLAAARAFRGRGHDVVVIERETEIGGVWTTSRAYPGVRTQSAKAMYAYADRPMPADYPEWPDAGQVRAYLLGFAKEFGLAPLVRLGVDVVSLDRRDDGEPGWRVRTRDARGAPGVENFDFVAICTGQFSDKNMPEFDGRAAFEAAGGSVLHSSDYRDPQTLRGKRVVVLGASKSATDVAVNAVEAGAASTTIVYREPRWRVPYFLAGLINFRFVIFLRVLESMFPDWRATRRGNFLRALFKPLIWLNWRAFETLLKVQLGLKGPDLIPTQKIDEVVNCSFPVATPGFYDMTRDGRIAIQRGTFAHYEAGAVALDNGERLGADVVLLATGWRLDVPYLSAADRAKLVEPDGLYRLYRLIANPDLPNLGFVGFNSSFATMLTSHASAEWLVRYADGQLARQPSVQEMREDIERMMIWRREVFPSAQTYNGLCVAPFHFRHLDELIADMGAKVRRRNIFVEALAPLSPTAYGRFIASAPDYRANSAPRGEGAQPRRTASGQSR